MPRLRGALRSERQTGLKMINDPDRWLNLAGSIFLTVMMGGLTILALIGIVTLIKLALFGDPCS